MRTLIRGLLLALIALVLPATASAAFEHTVSRGESLSSVAAADGLTVDQLAAANGVSPDTQLVVGTRLTIPPQGAVAGVSSVAAPVESPDADGDGDVDGVAVTAAAAPAAGGVVPAGGYVVQPGDTLSAIAARYGLTAGELAAQDGLNPNAFLVAGTQIALPGAPVSSRVPAATAAAVAPAPAAASTAQPSDQYVSPSEVGSIAAANGVPASLAEAIGYQESGFNNAEVSATGATGIMQIEPGTWNYIGTNLAGPPPLSPGSATDNIRAGSLLLRSLLAETGGDPAMAAAAYYQGLQSVREHGMYADTQRYVNNVMALAHRFGG
jgi:LysM repeat protein